MSAAVSAAVSIDMHRQRTRINVTSSFDLLLPLRCVCIALPLPSARSHRVRRSSVACILFHGPSPVVLAPLLLLSDRILTHSFLFLSFS